MKKVKEILFVVLVTFLVCYLIDQATGLSKFEESQDKSTPEQVLKIRIDGPVVCLER